MRESKSEQNNPWVTIWTHPRLTMKRILQNNPLKMIIPLAVANGLVSAISWIGFYWTSAPHREDYQHYTFVIALLVTGGLLGILNLYVGSWLLRITGSWVGGKGGFREVKSAVGWSNYPFIISGIFSILAYTFVSYPILEIIFGLLNIIVFIWAVVIFFNLVGVAHAFSPWRAIVALLIAFVIVFIAVMLVALLIPLLKPLFVD